MMLNIGCGNDNTGSVRIDKVPTLATNLIADAHNLPLREAFTKTKCYRVFEHLQNPFQALNELKKVLFRDGTIEICVPNITEIRRVIANVYNPQRKSKNYGDESHLQGWDISTFREMINRVGEFKIEQVKWITEGKHEKFAFLNGILRRILPPGLYFKHMVITLKYIPNIVGEDIL